MICSSDISWYCLQAHHPLNHLGLLSVSGTFLTWTYLRNILCLECSSLTLLGTDSCLPLPLSSSISSCASPSLIILIKCPSLPRPATLHHMLFFPLLASYCFLKLFPSLICRLAHCAPFPNLVRARTLCILSSSHFPASGTAPGTLWVLIKIAGYFLNAIRGWTKFSPSPDLSSSLSGTDTFLPREGVLRGTGRWNIPVWMQTLRPGCWTNWFWFHMAPGSQIDCNSAAETVRHLVMN